MIVKYYIKEIDLYIKIELSSMWNMSDFNNYIEISYNNETSTVTFKGFEPYDEDCWYQKTFTVKELKKIAKANEAISIIINL